MSSASHKSIISFVWLILCPHLATSQPSPSDISTFSLLYFTLLHAHPIQSLYSLGLISQTFRVRINLAAGRLRPNARKSINRHSHKRTHTHMKMYLHSQQDEQGSCYLARHRSAQHQAKPLTTRVNGGRAVSTQRICLQPYLSLVSTPQIYFPSFVCLPFAPFSLSYSKYVL